MNNPIYSNGKLLLTAEYAVLDGAKALALPTTFGQSLTLGNTASDTLDWVSLDENSTPWFSARFLKHTLKPLHTTDIAISDRLTQILTETKRLNPKFLAKGTSVNAVETQLTFPKNWGLGSSSTLVSNIAKWADVNPYTLLFATFGGSGYDIACARHDRPILYQKNHDTPIVRELDFSPPFSEHLFFVYLNQKKNSRDAIRAYRNLKFDKQGLISQIDTITEHLLICSDLPEFERLIDQHEQLLSKTLAIPTVKASLFSDYRNGTVKSLGAWGGDFILVTGAMQDMEYFKKKGYVTIVSYAEMIK
ncbi:MAG: GYDIA family GHMP kinase [Maribacter sp.]